VPIIKILDKKFESLSYKPKTENTKKIIKKSTQGPKYSLNISCRRGEQENFGIESTY